MINKLLIQHVYQGLFFLEEEFVIVVEAKEMIPGNFDSAMNVIKYVESKVLIGPGHAF